MSELERIVAIESMMPLGIEMPSLSYFFGCFKESQ